MCIRACHHNVGGLPEDLQFELVEPLRTLFKDEVRAIGRELGLPEVIVCLLYTSDAADEMECV